MEPDRIIIHVDMDSFFASVEVRERPVLRGHPVVVGADPKDGWGRGVVSTCSYEARKYGVHSAMPISTAFGLCPHATFLPVNFRLYRAVSDKIMEILHSYTEKFQQVSIDEAYLDVSDLGDFETAVRCATRIKGEILATEGITCSIGVAPNKLIAKIGSDHQKPDGLTVIEPEMMQEFLGPLSVGKIPGIGKKTGTLLNSLGVTTIGELASYDVQALQSRFGKWGLKMHQIAHGMDSSKVSQRGPRKSIGRERTFDEDTADPLALHRMLDVLVQDVHRTLKQKHLKFRTLTVKIRYRGFETQTKSRTFPHYTDDVEVIVRNSRNIISNLSQSRPIRLIGLRLSAFELDSSSQMSILDYLPENPHLSPESDVLEKS